MNRGVFYLITLAACVFVSAPTLVLDWIRGLIGG
jgi:hypothetical protein